MTKLFHKRSPFSFSIVHIPRKYTDKNTGKKIHSIIAKFKSWKSSKEFYDAKPINFVNGRKKPGLNCFNVSADLTRRRSLLLKTAKELRKDNPNISYAYADINCSLGNKFKSGSFKYFNGLNELHSLL